MFDQEKLKVFFRGEFVDFADANISIANTGFLYGLGAFLGIRAHYNDQKKELYVFRLKDHFERLQFSCKLLRHENFLSYDYEKFESIVLELLRVNKITQDAYIRVTNFTDENLITPKLVGYADSLSIFLYPMGDYVPISGIKCMVSSWGRVEDNAIPARGKLVGAYINTAFAKSEAILNGYDEAIFLDDTGHVVEGSAENIFIVRDGTAITPPVTDNILEGITRRSAMEILQDQGVEVIERKIDRTELYRASEVFLTGTGAQVCPVVEIDKYRIGDGVVGPVTSRLQSTYFDVVRGNVEKYASWLLKA